MGLNGVVIGLLIGMLLGGYIAWEMYTKEMNEWKELFKDILPQLTGYKNLKDRLK